MRGSSASRFLSLASSGLRLQLLCTVFLLSSLAFVWLLLRDPVVAWRLARMNSANRQAKPSADSDARLSKDPLPGFSLGSDPRFALLSDKFPRSNKGWLIVPVGECASCISVNIAQWHADSKKRHVTLVLLTSATPSRAAEFVKHLHINAPLVLDQDGRLLQRLNVAWTARPYFFSEDWHLVWLPKKDKLNYNVFEEKDFQRALEQVNL